MSRLTLSAVLIAAGMKDPQRAPCPYCGRERSTAEILTVETSDKVPTRYLCANDIQEKSRAAAALIGPTIEMVETDALAIVDMAQTMRSRMLISPGEDKAQVYDALRMEAEEHDKLIRGAITILPNQIDTKFPAMAAMIDVFKPGSTSVTTRKAALDEIAVMVKAGQLNSQPALWKMNAIRVKAKDDIRKATTKAAKMALAKAAVAALNAIS